MNEGTKVDLSGAANAVKEMKKENTANLADAYVEKPVLNPDTIGASLLDRMGLCTCAECRAGHGAGWVFLSRGFCTPLALRTQALLSLSGAASGAFARLGGISRSRARDITAS